MHFEQGKLSPSYRGRKLTRTGYTMLCGLASDTHDLQSHLVSMHEQLKVGAIKLLNTLSVPG